jgi:hypothetical protein
MHDFDNLDEPEPRRKRRADFPERPVSIRFLWGFVAAWTAFISILVIRQLSNPERRLNDINLSALFGGASLAIFVPALLVHCLDRARRY